MSTNKAGVSPGVGTKKPDAVSQQQVEAARYAVLRRLSPALRHHMVRPLQPIGLIYGVMDHRFCATEPDIQSLRIQAEEINAFAKAALAECLDISSWLAPEPETLTEFAAGVTECIGLMASRLHFCGFCLVNDVNTPPVQVYRDDLRMVLIAVLFEMTDALTEPAILTLSASLDKEEATLFLRATPRADGRVERYDDGYRALTWRDVEALAAAADAGVSRQGNEVVMRFAIHAAGSVVH